MLNVLKNIASEGVGRMSSIDEDYIRNANPAQDLISLPMTGRIKAKTCLEENPWWEVDFGRTRYPQWVVIYNYDDGKNHTALQYRARFLEILVSQDGRQWRKIYTCAKSDGGYQHFAGIFNGPLAVQLPGEAVRFVRVQINATQYLNLAGIEIFEAADVDKIAAILYTVEAAKNHNFVIAKSNYVALSKDGVVWENWLSSQVLMLNEKALSFFLTSLHEDRRFEEAENIRVHYESIGLLSPCIEIARIRQEVAAGNIDVAKSLYSRLCRAFPYLPELTEIKEELSAIEEVGSDQVVKLVVWDLDDTLWDGTLADGHELVLKQSRADFVKQSRNHGLINSICSKNDPDAASSVLNEFGLGDCFIMPQIAFEQKGWRIKRLIENLQLREKNCLFIDDNPLNLNEVRFVCPGIQVADARDPSTDQLLSRLLAAAHYDGGKRFKEYKVIEQKSNQLQVFDGDNNDFLSQSGIKISFVMGAKNQRFAKRIEELVNRSNQLNFTKTRIPEGTAGFLVGDFANHFTISVFVKDKYGSYGLAGFAAVELKPQRLHHFVFSCRIMNMGVESFVMSYILDRFQNLDVRPVSADVPDYIELLDDNSTEFAEEFAAAGASVRADIRLMANCQSGVFSHYTGLSHRIDVEQWPDVFTLDKYAMNNPVFTCGYRYVIFGIFNEYDQLYWEWFTMSRFCDRLSQFVSRMAQDGTNLFLLIPPDSDIAALVDSDGKEVSFRKLNNFVRKLSTEHECVTLIELGAFGAGMVDFGEDLRHFSRDLQRRAAEFIGKTICVA